ncbi:uncharacterized protein LOC115929112 [Strongylocentrotus purpuratus]|uniref:Integrase catalytic domain-containing protein n=1 Tax=Strongylocentrotus purpuratus TaxID=7668 RepID=A0A7M7T4G1_STRPU|nr:uncharacterized protein LOC115929112 [Strongylocentrotus purpuratus]
MKDQTAPTIAKHLFEEYVKEHGIPETLHTDQGRQFESRLVQELCSKLGIKKSRSTPYHPQGAGIVERCNRTIKDQLAKYISHQGGEWDTHINQVQLAYNTSTHASTGLTPYYIMHGREARTPANITCSTPPPSSSGKTLLEYTTNLSERLRKAWEYTIQNTRQQQQQQKRQYDVKKRISNLRQYMGLRGQRHSTHQVPQQTTRLGERCSQINLLAMDQPISHGHLDHQIASSITSSRTMTDHHGQVCLFGNKPQTSQPVQQNASSITDSQTMTNHHGQVCLFGNKHQASQPILATNPGWLTQPHFSNNLGHHCRLPKPNISCPRRLANFNSDPNIN